MLESAQKHSLSVREAFLIGVRSARVNILPAFILQFVAVSLLIAYRCSPFVRDQLDVIAELQRRYGIVFATLVRGLFSGLVPVLFQIAIPSLRPARIRRLLCFSVSWWSLQGAMIYLFYAMQSVIFGSDTGWKSVLPKVALDMLFYTPFVGCLSNSVAHIWFDLGCSWKRLRPMLRRGWYKRIVFPNLIPAWALWTPGVVVIYSLPDALQVHMSSFIGCFWALLCLKIAAYTKK